MCFLKVECNLIQIAGSATRLVSYGADELDEDLEGEEEVPAEDMDSSHPEEAKVFMFPDVISRIKIVFLMSNERNFELWLWTQVANMLRRVRQDIDCNFVSLV